MIAVRSLTKHYGSRLALDGVSFAARDGTITGLLGPNGAGKTTTFRVVSGLLPADGGEVELNDNAEGSRGRSDESSFGSWEVVSWKVTPTRSRRRLLGVLPQSPGVYGRLTVREHLFYFGRLHEMPERSLATRAAELLTLLRLNEQADSLASTLSEGQRARVAIACMLVHGPANLVLDEPTTGLDVMSARAVHALLRELRDRGACILFSSHVMHEVAALCDEVVMLARGRVVATGPPLALLERHGAESLEDLFVRVSEETMEAVSS
jgi:sodium transport system ATP-binding protein